MATQYAPDSHSDTSQHPMLLNSLNHVIGTTGSKTTNWREQGGNTAPIYFYQAKDY